MVIDVFETRLLADFSIMSTFKWSKFKTHRRIFIFIKNHLTPLDVNDHQNVYPIPMSYKETLTFCVRLRFRRESFSTGNTVSMPLCDTTERAYVYSVAAERRLRHITAQTLNSWSPFTDQMITQRVLCLTKNSIMNILSKAMTWRWVSQLTIVNFRNEKESESLSAETSFESPSFNLSLIFIKHFVHKKIPNEKFYK